MAEALKGALVVGQSGGPSIVINASALGVIRTAFASEHITKVYGAYHGIDGVLDDKLMDMDEAGLIELDKFMYSPASALGSCRTKMPDPKDDDTKYRQVLEVFKKHNVRYFCYIGGNDSMDTCNKISKYMKSVGYECRIMGVPKTIDNDLFGTDHCPGYGSSAKYIATSIMEVARDAAVYEKGAVTVFECMGRHAGWLTAAAALANVNGHCLDYIYLPERDFDMDKFISDIKSCYEKNGNCNIAVSEGVHYADGSFITEVAASATDGFGHVQLGGLAAYLAAEIKNRLGLKTRGIEFSLLQRCAAHCSSGRDVEEAYMSGRAAVESMLDGTTDKMVGLECVRYPHGGFDSHTVLFDLDKVANFEKKVPLEWINEEGNNVTDAFIEYALPLIQGDSPVRMRNGLPDYTDYNKVFVDPIGSKR